jgi:hypothetical protein
MLGDYRIGSLKTAARELGKCKLDLVGVQEVRWEKGGTEQAEDYKFFYGQGNGDHHLGTGFFVHKRIVSVVSRVEFISERMSYLLLRGHWYNITVLNAQAQCEDKGDDVKDSFYEALGHVFIQFPRYDMKILLVDFNANVRMENIFKPTTGDESLQEISNDNTITVVNFARSKSLILKCTMFPHRKIHKYIWISPEGKTYNQTDHVLTDRRRHSRILDVSSFRGADCDTDHYLAVAKVRERLASE